MKKSKKPKFNQDRLIQDLYDLYHDTISRKVHFKIAMSAVKAAKAIALHISVKNSQKGNKL